MEQTWYYVTVCIGDCEFNEEFTLKYPTLGDAEQAKIILESAMNVISVDIV